MEWPKTVIFPSGLLVVYSGVLRFTDLTHFFCIKHSGILPAISLLPRSSSLYKRHRLKHLIIVRAVASLHTCAIKRLALLCLTGEIVYPLFFFYVFFYLTFAHFYLITSQKRREPSILTIVILMSMIFKNFESCACVTAILINSRADWSSKEHCLPGPATQHMGLKIAH